mmetsp:Transcript_101547/g.287734  ORF Transcript_101547/g.287734 Transcript_101547/m.287734 type:complete len:320 (-) Transcript_101547:40-999(-)
MDPGGAERDWAGIGWQHIQTRLEGRILVIQLSRPKQRNAWTEVMRNEIIEAVDTANRDPKVRVLVFTGNPEGNSFCAGMDLNGMPGGGVMPGDVAPGRRGQIQYARDGGGQASLAIARSLKPCIAAINGPAVGIGATLTTPMDFRIAAEDAKMGFVFGKRGLTMEGCSSFFLPRLVGLTKANDFVLTGRVFTVKEEEHCGLFTRVVPRDRVMPEAMELARSLLLVSPMSTMLNRHLIQRGFSDDSTPESAHLNESMCISWNNPDGKEGVKSFLEKRDPEFSSDPWRDTPPFFPWWKELSVIPGQPRYDRTPRRPDLSKL